MPCCNLPLQHGIFILEKSDIIAKLIEGDRRALARVISWVENESQGYDELLQQLHFNKNIPIEKIEACIGGLGLLAFFGGIILANDALGYGGLAVTFATAFAIGFTPCAEDMAS